MGKLIDIFDEYKILFREIGIDISIPKIMVLEIIQAEPRPIKITPLATKARTHRTETYKIIRIFEKYGLVHVHERGTITPEEEAYIESQTTRSKRARVRRRTKSGLRVSFTPLGITPHINARIHDLEDFKERLNAGEIFNLSHENIQSSERSPTE